MVSDFLVEHISKINEKYNYKSKLLFQEDSTEIISTQPHEVIYAHRPSSHRHRATIYMMHHKK